MAGQVKITKALALRLLKEAVEKKGADYVDPLAMGDGPGCKYAHGRKPGCIVGHVLYGVGLKPKALRELDDPGGIISLHLGDLRERGVEMTPAALDVLRAAQARQDSGDSWGEALKAARQA